MRPLAAVFGTFTPRETFLLNCIRDLEERVERVERCLRIQIAEGPALTCKGNTHVFWGGPGCVCGKYPQRPSGTDAAG